MIYLKSLLDIEILRKSLKEQQNVLADFWKKAEYVLSGSGVELRPIPKSWTAIRRNYFSVLFISIYYHLGIPLPRLRLYARLNHCLRSWVTSCDNLFDREMKEILKTDLPEGSIIFKSVHTILVTDRIMFLFLLDAVRRGTMSEGEMDKLLAVSLSSITASGVEEAGEEKGADFSLSPEEVLNKIHSAKSGQLFTSPLAAPSALGDIGNTKNARCIREGLFHFGIGCQILDDMNDLEMDMIDKKHNYVAALIFHGGSGEKRHLSRMLDTIKKFDGTIKFQELFPEAYERAGQEMLNRFQTALDLLCEAGFPLGISERKTLIKALLVILKRPEIVARLRRI